MRPFEKLLLLDPLRHKVADELGAHAISFKGGMVLLAALKRVAEFLWAVTPGIPKLCVDDSRAQHTEADAFPALKAKRVGETKYCMLGGDVGRDARGRCAHSMMRGRVTNPRFRAIRKKAPAERSATAEHAIHVHLELSPQILVGRVESRSGCNYARVVAEDL